MLKRSERSVNYLLNETCTCRLPALALVVTQSWRKGARKSTSAVSGSESPKAFTSCVGSTYTALTTSLPGTAKRGAAAGDADEDAGASERGLEFGAHGPEADQEVLIAIRKCHQGPPGKFDDLGTAMLAILTRHPRHQRAHRSRQFRSVAHPHRNQRRLGEERAQRTLRPSPIQPRDTVKQRPVTAAARRFVRLPGAEQEKESPSAER